MNITRLNTLAYAEGFVESFIEEYLEGIDEETAEPRTMEQALQLKNMWQVLATGVKDLRAENLTLDMKVQSAKLALS